MHFVHEHLSDSASKIMAVFEPLKVVITNYPCEENKTFEVPNVKRDPFNKRNHKVAFDKEMWIEKSDFRKVEEKGFRHLTMNQWVCLLHTRHVIFPSDILRLQV